MKQLRNEVKSVGAKKEVSKLSAPKTRLCSAGTPWRSLYGDKAAQSEQISGGASTRGRSKSGISKQEVRVQSA